MKRHPGLHPLSRDHHNVLVHARRLRGLDARFDAEAARRRFLSYAPVLWLHFGEEEAVLAPRIQDDGLRQRLLDEHADLRQRAASLPPTADGQAALGEALRLHVRFEEDELFPHLEATLDAAAWEAVQAESLAYRKAQRPASLAGEEACFL